MAKSQQTTLPADVQHSQSRAPSRYPRRSQAEWETVRLQAAQLFAQGQRQCEVMRALGVSRSAVSAAAVGRISDRRGHKRALVLSTLSSGIFCIPQAIAQSVVQLLALRALFDLAAGGTGPTVNAIVSKTTPRGAHGKAYGITFAVGWMGGAIGPLLGGFITRWRGLRAPFVIVGASLTIISLVVALGIKETQGLARQHDDHSPPR